MKARTLVISAVVGLLAAEMVRQARRRSTDPVFRTDLSRVVSEYIGETEKNLRRLFDRAEEGGRSSSSMRRMTCSATEPERPGGILG